MSIFKKIKSSSPIAAIILTIAILDGCTSEKVECESNFIQKSAFDKLSTTQENDLKRNLIEIGKSCKIDGENEKKYFTALIKFINTSNTETLLSFYKTLDEAGLDVIRFNFLNLSDVLKISSSNPLIPPLAKSAEFEKIGKLPSKSNITSTQNAAIKVLEEDVAPRLLADSVITGHKDKNLYYFQLTKNDGGSGGTTDLSINLLSENGVSDQDLSKQNNKETNITIESWGTGGDITSSPIIIEDRIVGLVRNFTTLSKIANVPLAESIGLCDKIVQQYWELDSGALNLKLERSLPCDKPEALNIETSLTFFKAQKTPPEISSLINYDRLDAADRLIIKKLISTGAMARKQLIYDLENREKINTQIKLITEVEDRKKILGKTLKSLNYIQQQSPNSNTSYLIESENELANLDNLLEKLPKDAIDSTRTAEFKTYNLIARQQMDYPAKYENHLYQFIYIASPIGQINSLMLIASDRPIFSGRGLYNIFGRVTGKEKIKMKEELGGFTQEVDVIIAANEEETKLITSNRQSNKLISLIIEKCNFASSTLENALKNFRQNFIEAELN